MHGSVKGGIATCGIATGRYVSSVMLMRLRLPELLEARGLTAYQIVKASDGRISTSTAYRVVRNRGRAKSFDASFLEALCDVLGVTPGELFERDGNKQPKRR
jgi:DNA-binding Xre family transcriptional regulator